MNHFLLGHCAHERFGGSAVKLKMVAFNASPSLGGCLSPDLGVSLGGLGDSCADISSRRTFEQQNSKFSQMMPTAFGKSSTLKPRNSQWTRQKTLLAAPEVDSPIAFATWSGLRGSSGVDLIICDKQTVTLSSLKGLSQKLASMRKRRTKSSSRRSPPGRGEVYIASLSSLNVAKQRNQELQSEHIYVFYSSVASRLDVTMVDNCDPSHASAKSGVADLRNDHPVINGLSGLYEMIIEGFEEWCTKRRRNSSPNFVKLKIPEVRTGSQLDNCNLKGDRLTDVGTGLDDDGSVSPPRQGKKAKLDESEDRRLLLACPFYKKDNMRHQGCLRYQLNRIKDVKQHLFRRHLQPLYCPLCGQEFETQHELRHHIRTQLCTRREFEEPEGITDDQRVALSTRAGRTMTLEQQWYTIWDATFPGFEHPSSVYVQDVVPEMLCNFQIFFNQHGRMLIAERLRSQGLPYMMSSEERDMAAVVSQVATEVVETLIERYTSTFSSAVSDVQETTLPALVDDEEVLRTDLEPNDDLTWPSMGDASLAFDACFDFFDFSTIDEQP